MFDTHNNHTLQLAKAISNGILSGGSSVDIFSVSDTSAPTSYSDVAKYHGFIIGSPVFFGNPSSQSLQWIFSNLGPGWENRTFANLPAAVFATGGGIHQGTEGTLESLTRALLNFGFRPVTPDVETNGYSSSLGASAVTGTPPYFIGTNPVAKQFLDAGSSLGAKLAKEVQKEWFFRCSVVNI
jgi:multimeric flavodoxin WrbA